MARKPKPYAYRGWYCTSVGGVTNRKLCRVEEGKKAANRALARVLGELKNSVVERQPLKPVGATPPYDCILNLTAAVSDRELPLFFHRVVTLPFLPFCGLALKGVMYEAGVPLTIEGVTYDCEKGCLVLDAETWDVSSCSTYNMLIEDLGPEWQEGSRNS